MPRQAADLEEALKKKGGLTLSQLANYDDLITDALVDRVYFWSTIRKLKATYHPCRGVQEEDVCDILRNRVINEKDPTITHKELLQLPGIHKFYRALKTEDEREHFERHLRKYINIYLPDCPFDVGTTNKYTVMTAEAAIYARKPIRKGEAIKYLSGIQVEMTEREEKELCSRTDFSIVLSSRRKRPSLFLGPARFANHDCDSNARLNTSGPHGIHIVARKDIAAGDEITVTYGDDYFGEDNCECLCGTCEDLVRNGWDPRGPLLKDDSSDDEEDSEDEAEEVKPRWQPPAPMMSRKRKRGEDTLAALVKREPASSGKRGPGRPRKYPLPPGETMSRYKRRKAEAEASARGDSFVEVGPSRPCTAGTKPGRDSYASEWAQAHDALPHDPLLGRIVSLLSSIGDRVIRQRSIERKQREHEARGAAQQGASPEIPETEPDRLSTPEDVDTQAGAEAGLDQDVDDVDEIIGDCEPCPRDRGGRFTPLPLPSDPQRESSASANESRISAAPLPLGSEAEASKLARIKKEHSYSALRNVTTATNTSDMITTAEDDVWSVPASPAPDSLPPAKRRKGWLQKQAEPDVAGGVEASTGCTSPSSNGMTDSSSNGSLASSATSLETLARPQHDAFAAGNIALSICNMLTTDLPTEEEVVYEPPDETEVAAVEDTPVARDRAAAARAARQSKRSGSAKQRVREAESLAAATDEQALTPQRGRRSARVSPHDARGEQSTPPVQSIEEVDKSEESSETDEKRGPPRTPGDYHLCRALLATAYHRWVGCRNCDRHFVQADAYLTRIACPRCERHSKLYGYYWPKTDKEGKFDMDERILDHRTIHRFIEPEEERSERKGRKTLAEQVREREMSRSRFESEESGPSAERKLRGSPRREGRRALRSTM